MVAALAVLPDVTVLAQGIAVWGPAECFLGSRQGRRYYGLESGAVPVHGPRRPTL